MKVISFINLKGGVAKTTTTVGVAEALSVEFGKKVLVIDLDPQTNATVMLIGEEKWGKLDKNGFTLATLFSDAIEEEWNFNLENTIQRGVGVTQAKTLDLLPSSLRLITLQDKLITMPKGTHNMRHPVNIIYSRVKNIIDDYDYVLIDCPPNLGYITQNGLRISDGYVIPTIPDAMSTYGIPQIMKHIDKFSYDLGINIELLGIVATKVRKQAAIHNRILGELRRNAGKPYGKRFVHPKVFETYFPESSRLAEAAEYLEGRTLRQKWSGDNDAFFNFTRELMKACEVD